MPLTPLAARYDNVILDLDGCVWIAGDPTPGAVEAIALLRSEGKRVAFVTNNPRRAVEDEVAKLWRAGIQASVGDVVSVGAALQHVLADGREGRTAYVIGTEALQQHVIDAGLKLMNGTDLATRAEVVVVAGTEEVTYEDIRCAAMSARRGAELLATSRDPTYPQADGYWPGTGAILAAVEVASGKTARIVGKPEPQMIHTALDRMGAGKTLMIGDRIDSDLGAAASAGIDAALVLTGGADPKQIPADGPQPVKITETLAELLAQ